MSFAYSPIKMLRLRVVDWSKCSANASSPMAIKSENIITAICACAAHTRMRNEENEIADTKIPSFYLAGNVPRNKKSCRREAGERSARTSRERLLHKRWMFLCTLAAGRFISFSRNRGKHKTQTEQRTEYANDGLELSAFNVVRVKLYTTRRAASLH